MLIYLRLIQKSNPMENENFHDANVHKIFNKKFNFHPDDSWKLPDQLYEDEPYVFPEFQSRKSTLNAVKEKLSQYDLDEWSKHTKKRDPSTTIIKTIRSIYQPELVTQAWCKFYESLCQYKLICPDAILNDSLYSVHLCEAPGAFICALNHFLQLYHPNIKWEWLGMSLNPNYEGNSRSSMIPDDRLMQHTPNNWYYGSDLTGDITKYHNHITLVEKFKDTKVQLITADGSIDCMSNPGDQEKIVEYLHYCEVVTALKILAEGGNFVIKMFTMFEEGTISVVYMLNCCFEEVNVFKPCTSKSGNSEVYVICLRYRKSIITPQFLKMLSVPYKNNKIEKALFSKSDISATFLKQLSTCSVYFMEYQINTINENIVHFKKKNSYVYNKYVKSRSKNIVDVFLQENHISGITADKRVVKHINLNRQRYVEVIDDIASFNPNLDVKLSTNDIDIGVHIDVKIGKYISNLYYSKYHNVRNYSYFFTEKSKFLFHIASSVLKSFNTIISVDNFHKIYGVSEFHQMFYETLAKSLDIPKNIIIINLPLLTNFLVGLVFLTSTCFRSVWFIKNTIVLENPLASRITTVREHLSKISCAYSKLNKHADFVEDILQVVDTKMLHSGEFFDCVCQYNVNVLRNT